MADPDAVWFRAITINCNRGTVFRWLCQLKVSPYSYDLVDNLGRRSPRTLTPGVEQLELGQRVMTIFELVEFDPDGRMTILLETPFAARLFGKIALSYVLRDAGPGSCRLIVKMAVRNADGGWGGVRRRLLAWGDLLMMRRQLLNLKKLAERQARADNHST